VLAAVLGPCACPAFAQSLQESTEQQRELAREVTEPLSELEPMQTPSDVDIIADLLQPVDTSGPRETLSDFLERVERMYAVYTGALAGYLQSDRLYFSKEERRALSQTREMSEILARSMDFERLPVAIESLEYRLRIVLTLKDILDRVHLPPMADIPDGEEMALTGKTKWRVPGTHIEIGQLAEGDRAGEWLFTAQTILELPHMERRAQGLPFVDIRTRDFLESYRDGFLGALVPYRWILALPDQAKARIADQPVWRWIAFGLLLAASAAAFALFRRLTDWLRRRAGAETRVSDWIAIAVPAGLALLLILIREAVSHYLRFGEPVYAPMMITLAALLYLTVIWLIWTTGKAIAETVISSRQLLKLSIDGQLIRLAVRLVAIVLTIMIFVEGANRIGLPAYSVVAGLGVGGIAVAFAARESLANLIGSFTIMMEKPFRIGHWVRVGETEGIVEAVGFRSTVIRTFYNSVVTVPSTKLIESVIDNFERRSYRRFKTTLSVTYNTPPDRLLEFVAAVRDIIANHPYTWKDDYQVYVQDFGESSIEILLYVFFDVPDWPSELRQREDLIVRILRCAEDQEVKFAFPTRTLEIAASGSSQLTRHSSAM